MTRLLADGLARWVTFAQRRCWIVLTAVLLVTTVAALAAWRLTAIDSDLSKLIRPSDALRWYRHDLEFKSAFPEFQQTAVVVVAGPDHNSVDVVARDLAGALRARPELQFVYAPTTDPFLRRQRLYFLGLADLEGWLQGLRIDYPALLRLADDPSIGSAALTFADLVSADSGLPLPSPMVSLVQSFTGSGAPQLRLAVHPSLADPDASRYYALLQIKGVQRHDQALPGAELVALLEEEVAATPVPDDVAVRLTGEVVLAHEEIGAALDGIGIAGSVSLILLAVILGFGVRSLRIILAIFLLLGLGSALTLGFAAVTVGTFNTLALMFVIMFFGLGVDFAVHFAMRVREAHASGRSDLAASASAARDIGPALLLCMVTSSIAFLSFTPTAYRGLGELGIISAGGMLTAFVLSLTLIPALFGAFGMPTGSWTGTSVGRRLARLRPLPVLAATGCLAVAAAWWAKDLEFDYSVLALRDADSEAMSTLLELQQADISTDYSISVLARPDEVAALATRLAALPEVAAVATPRDWIPADQNAKRLLLEDAAQLIATVGPVHASDSSLALPDVLDYLEEVAPDVPADRREDYRTLVVGVSRLADQPQQLARLDEALARELETGLAELRDMLTAQPFDLEDLPAPMRTRSFAPDGRHLLTVEPAGTLATRADMEAFITAVASVAPNFAGRAVVEWGVGEVVVGAFLEAATLALGGIVLLLVWYFRSLLLPVLVLTPLLLATLFTFALAELVGLSLNMANILVVPLIFGLGVDSGIHVVHRFSHGGGIEAVFASSTARAVAISALTTIGTFFSLSFSPHKGAASVGLLLSIAIALMLIVTYLVLPALLRSLYRP